MTNNEQEAARCAEAMEALADEIAVGIGAITRNALPAVEGSIARQRALCPPLVELCRDQFVSKSWAQLDARVAAAAARLRRLNREYAALLEHSGRTLRMLQALYKTARGADGMWQGSELQQGVRRWQG